MKKHPVYIVCFMMVLGLICALLLSLVNTFTAPYIKRNSKIELINALEKYNIELTLIIENVDLEEKMLAIYEGKTSDNDKCYIFFKNNCPCAGRLFDDFRICDSESKDVLYTIAPSCGYDCYKNKAVVWGRENDFEEPLVIGTWTEVKKWFLENIKLDGELFLNEDDNLNLTGKLKGIMILKDDITLEPVEYNFDTYLEEYTIKNLVKKYSDYIRYPIK